jgi:hypothetical protein
MATALATTTAGASTTVIIRGGKKQNTVSRGAFSPVAPRVVKRGRQGGSVAARAELQQWDAETAECMLMEGGSMVGLYKLKAPGCNP